jgi:DNA-binding Lrp family transcriptional regulator
MIYSMESCLPSIASDESPVEPTLDRVFGSRGQIQLLRILVTETAGSIASVEVSDRTGMTPSGARKALRRLVRAGIIRKVGSGRSTRYSLRSDGPLTGQIVRLFELERKRGESDGSPGLPAAVPTEQAAGNGSAAGHIQVDPASPDFHFALVSLLEEDLSLIRRARERVLEKLEHRHPGNGHDLWEWRKILDTYPLPRLLHFLESESPRAQRLRESSPFPEVMSGEEKERLGRILGRVH